MSLITLLFKKLLVLVLALTIWTSQLLPAAAPAKWCQKVGVTIANTGNFVRKLFFSCPDLTHLAPVPEDSIEEEEKEIFDYDASGMRVQKIGPVRTPAKDAKKSKKETLHIKIKSFMTPYDHKLYAIIEQEFGALRKKINHEEIALLVSEIAEQENKLTEQLREDEDKGEDEDTPEQPEQAKVFNSKSTHIESITDMKAQINNLQRRLANELRVSLTWNGERTEAGLMVPTIYKILHDIFEEIAIKSHLKMPDICVCLTLENNIFNNNKDTLMANAVSNREHHSIRVGEEFFKLFIWNQQARELLKAILAHEFGHLKIWSDTLPTPDPEKDPCARSREEEHRADAFGVSMLEQPEILIKALDMMLLDVSLNQVIHYHTKYSIHRVTEISRILANFIADTIPKLGALGNTATNTVFTNILNVIVQQAKISKHTGTRTGIIDTDSDTRDIVFDLADHITRACNNDLLIEIANIGASSITEKYPGPYDRRSYIENCIDQKKMAQAPKSALSK